RAAVSRGSRRGPRAPGDRRGVGTRRPRPGRTGGLDLRDPRAPESPRDDHTELTITRDLTYIRDPTHGTSAERRIPGLHESTGVPGPFHRRGRKPGPGLAARPVLAAGRGSLAVAAPRSVDGRDQPARFPPQGQADHLSLHGGRAVAPGDVRLQARPGTDARQADARVVHPRDADRPAPGTEARLLRAPASVPPVRGQRAG